MNSVLFTKSLDYIRCFLGDMRDSRHPKILQKIEVYSENSNYFEYKNPAS